MFKILDKNIFLNFKNPVQITKKIGWTLLLVYIYRFANTIPLIGIDQEALRETFLNLNKNTSIGQLLMMYSGGGGGVTLLSPFSLGIIPYINASILIDLLVTIFPTLEKLQTEEGEFGRRQINYYKKGATFIFAILQSFFFLIYLKPYIYINQFLYLGLLSLELTTGALIILWLSNLIDKKGIGGGTSILICINSFNSLFNKDWSVVLNSSPTNLTLILDIFLFFFIIFLICLSQLIRFNIDVVSARQLVFLENLEDSKISANLKKEDFKENGLSIRYNQAGIFPIIIASNFIPFISYFIQTFFTNLNLTSLISILFYLLIIGFNYFYTNVFWDPEKISEQLRKASVSILMVRPGKETTSYLSNIVRSTSLLGCIFICLILFFYDLLKPYLANSFLIELNLSSLMIMTGVAYEIQRTLQGLLQNFTQTSKI